MNKNERIPRRTLLSMLAASPLMAGCLPVPADLGDGLPESSMGNSPETEQEGRIVEIKQDLKSLLDKVLLQGFRRELDVGINAAWQVLHGVLAYGTECLVTTTEGTQKAVNYLLDGGKLAGFEPFPGDMIEGRSRRGLSFEMDVSSLVGQGHRDQWLAILYQTGLPTSTEIKVSRQIFTIEDCVAQAAWDVPRNVEQEYSWTVIGLIGYRGTDFAWKARDGRQWSIEQLVETESRASLEMAACGGTHRLIGLAIALSAQRKTGRPAEGAWADAQRRVSTAIEQAREYQNGDGSFSTAYLYRRGWSPDLSDILRTTGHVLEFLSIACTDDQLSEPWITRAGIRLATVLDLTATVDLECGALYHALHGILLYRNRLFPDQPWKPS